MRKPKISPQERKTRNKIWQKKYRDKNKAKIKERRRKYLLESIDRRAKWAKEYNAKNREKTKVTKAKWKLENKSRIALTNLAYRNSNKEKRAAHGRKYYLENRDIFRNQDRVRRAREVSARIGDCRVIVKWEREWKARKYAICYWCSCKNTVSECHVDHIHPLSKGGVHEIGNLCISCSSCNWKKNAKTLDLWNESLLEPVLF